MPDQHSSLRASRLRTGSERSLSNLLRRLAVMLRGMEGEGEGLGELGCCDVMLVVSVSVMAAVADGWGVESSPLLALLCLSIVVLDDDGCLFCCG